MQQSTVHYSTVQYTIEQYTTLQYSTVQYSTLKSSTVQFSIPATSPVTQSDWSIVCAVTVLLRCVGGTLYCTALHYGTVQCNEV